MKDSSVYDLVTSRIISLLEQGTVPWRQPWTSSRQWPQNLVSKHHYHGINVFVLQSMHYASPFWVSYKQAQELGGHVKKGAKSCPVIYFKQLEITDKDTEEVKRIPLLRYYSVFNVAQVKGVEVPQVTPQIREHSPIQAAEAIVAGMPKRPEIKNGMAQAFYSPLGDFLGNLMIAKGPAAERRPAIVHPESDPGAFVAVDAVAGDGEITSGRSCIESEGQRPCLAHLLEQAEPQEIEFRSQVKWRLGAGGCQKRILATTCRRS